MTSPQSQMPLPASAVNLQQPVPSVSGFDFGQAIDRLNRLATGNTNINSHPGLMNALMQSNATPQQAQEIDQFMAGVKAQNMFTLAHETGAKINFTDAERNAMDTMGFNYSSVDALSANNQQAVLATLKAKGLQPVLNPNGTLATDATGNIVTQQAKPAPAAPQNSGGKGWGLGRVFHDITHNPVTNLIGEGANVANAAMTDVAQTLLDPTGTGVSMDPTGLLGIVGPSQPSVGSTAKQLNDQRNSEMQALGYNPNSVWSSLAFDAHGYGKIDIAPAINSWDQSNGPQAFGKSGADMLPEVLQFNKDPKAYQNSIIADPNLTPQQVDDKLALLNSDPFKQFSQRLNADTATIGHLAMTNAGVDPVKDAKQFALGAAGIDLIASLYTDPTLMLGNGVMALRKSAIAIDSLYDSERIAKVLDPATMGPLAHMSSRAAVVNGFQSIIDDGNAAREAFKAGDSAAVASAYAHAQKATPQLMPLFGDILGTAQADWRTTAEGITGLKDSMMATAAGEPITNLAEMVKYVTEKGGLIRLVGGKAAVESSYMPGALSNFGYKALRANMAAHAATVDTVRTAAADAEYLAARNAGKLSGIDDQISKAAFDRADPAVPTHTIDLSKIEKYLPGAIDGVDAKTGLVVAAPDASFIGQHVSVVEDALKQVKDAQRAVLKQTKGAEGAEIQPGLVQGLQDAARNVAGAKNDLASAIRAAADRSPKSGDWADALLPAERGQVAYNLRRFGSATEGGVGGWASPTAVAARARLAVARLTNTLPRNTTFDLEDAQTAEKVYKFARFYLGKGTANLLSAQYANGDMGTRKAIVEGLWDQVAHAAGMPRTSGGQELLANMRTLQQSYTHSGPGWIIDGSPVAMHDGQVTRSLYLPSFKQVQHAASKMGLYEGTVGRLGTSAPLDYLFNTFRFGILAAPKTAYRNIIEPYAKALLDGQMGEVMKARALTYMSADEWAKIGQKANIAELTGEVPESVKNIARQHLNDMAANGTARDQHVAKFMLSRVEKGDLSAMAGYNRTRAGSQMADIFSHVAGWYRTALVRNMSDSELAHVNELYDVLPQMAHGFGQSTVASSFDPFGTKAIRDITEAGLSPRGVEYNLASGDHPLIAGSSKESNTVYKRRGYGLEHTDKSVGQARYVNALAQRVYDAPDVAKAVMNVLRDPEADIRPVIEALDARVSPHLTAYGKYFKPDETTGKAIKALTPDEVALGKKQWATDVVNDFRYMLENAGGTLNTKIADYVTEHGAAPDTLWMSQNVKGGEIPRTVLAPEYEAQNLGGIHNLATALNDITGKVFNQIVEGPIKRQSSMPFLAAHYLNARAEQDAAGMLGKLISHGLDETTANELLKGQAVRNAYIRVEQMIDDPGLKTQFDIVARNLFMFPRAMQAFVRRWGGSLIRDPFKARKMMLALEGTEHSGLVYRDQNGELTFTYPGSEVMRDTMVALSHLPGFSGMAQFPTGMDMTGKVMLAAPGFDQPFRFSLSPMVNIPMRAVFSMFPEHQALWTEIDTALNGQIGAGRGLASSIEPSVIQKLISATNPDEKNSAFASAVIGAIAHLSAAGYMPGPSASTAELDQFNNRVKTQVRNQLFWRFAFGLIAPAPPSSLNENIDQSAAKPGGTGTGSDYTFHLQGIRNLSDEYKSILDATGGDVARASQIFTGLHPEGLAYTVPTTQAGISKAQLPATTDSLAWMEKNLGFLDKYKSVGAYFLPKATGAFDINAYHAQLTMGLRQKKSISEYTQAVETSQSEQEYFAKYDIYKAGQAADIASGDTRGASVLASGWNKWKTDFLNHNLFLKDKFALSSANASQSQHQLQDLQDMVKKNAVPDGLGPQVQQMLSLWQSYSTWKSQQTGSSTTTSAMRQAALDYVDQNLGQIAQSDPRLLNIYNGVFRTMDTQLAQVG